MKKPFLNALGAAVYIVFIVLAINSFSSIVVKETILIPMVMLSLFVLSAAIMGFLFVFQPLKLFIENKKEEAISLFFKTVAFFAGFVIVFVIAMSYASFQ